MGQAAQVASWRPMILRVQEMRRQQEQQWQMLQMGVDYQQKLGLETQRQIGRMDELRQRQQFELEKDTLTADELGVLGGMYPDVTWPESRKAATFMVDLVKAGDDKQAVDVLRGQVAQAYPDLGLAITAAPDAKSLLGIITDAEKRKVAAAEKAVAGGRAERTEARAIQAADLAQAKEERIAHDARMTRFAEDYKAFNALARPARRGVEAGPYSKPRRLGKQEHFARNISRQRYVALREVGLTDDAIAAEPWLKVASDAEVDEALRATSGDVLAASVWLRQRGLVSD